jgi:ATP-binding cassette subfamily F protein uup
MPVLTLEHGTLAFGHVALLDHAELQMEAGERLALIGRNGSGKSSLLHVMAGDIKLDDGMLWLRPGLSVSLVEQEPKIPTAATVFDAVAEGVGRAAALLRAYHEKSRRVAADASEILLRELHELQTRLEHEDGWRLNTRVEQILSRIGLDAEARVAELSGGVLKRVALARALVADSELLLLDEPTNHLDLDGIRWLEDLLLGFKGSVIVVTHDRRFLDAIATRVVELDRGRLTSFPGDFSAYEQRRQELVEIELRQSEKFDKLLAQEEAWIRKGIEARRTRNEGRVRRLEALRRERTARRERTGEVGLRLDRGESSGKLVAELSHVSKCFGERIVVRDFSCRIQRGDRIGFMGPNGVGKTSLLRLILGELEPDAGTVRLGSRLKVAYFDQFRAILDEDATLADVISGGSEYVDIGGQRKHVVGYLGEFLFSPQRARSPVRTLSGGERNRLLLARLFSRPANLLVLDEPTNDLDIETLELLEALLQDYDGTVFLVSHDRAFLDNVVIQVIAAQGNGIWREYVGGYADWELARSAQAVEPALAKRARASQGEGERPRSPRESRPEKLSFKEARELASLPERIAALEQEQERINLRLTDSALYREAPQEVAGLRARTAELEAEIARAMLRWEELELRAARS